MISYMISCTIFVIYDIIYDDIHNIMMSCIVFTYFSCLAAADRPPAQRADASDDDHDPDRSMDFDEERDFADVLS